MFADAYVRGLSKVPTINWDDAFNAMVNPVAASTYFAGFNRNAQLTNAEQVPKRNMDFNAFDGGTKEGRSVYIYSYVVYPHRWIITEMHCRTGKSSVISPRTTLDQSRKVIIFHGRSIH